MTKEINPIQLLLSLLIDYLRWTQFTPMILMWAMVLGMLFVLFFVSHENATWSMLGAVTEWIASLPWIGPRFLALMQAQAEDGVVSPDLGAIDYKSLVLWVWSGISLVFMVLAWVAGLFFGPFKRWTLRRKLGAAALACTSVVAIMMVLYFTNPQSWNAGPVRVALSASGMALVMFLINAWCLSVSHALGLMSAFVAQANFGRPDTADGIG